MKPTMQISSNSELTVSSDLDLIAAHLNPVEATLIELGCGTAATTLSLAERYPDCRIIAFEVDRTQHAKNLALAGPPNLGFRLGGAEHIDLPSDSVDAVLMLKSLHHVSVSVMDQALDEIARVLRPDGLAYISEPVYAGAFNDILRRFHDEKTVRESAFGAIQSAVKRGVLLLDREVHFLSLSRFDGFADFEARIIGATHTQFEIDDEKLEEIRRAFARHVDEDGCAAFLNPQRVDLLRKPM
jgi:SAM-dependent methyltransferase